MRLNEIPNFSNYTPILVTLPRQGYCGDIATALSNIKFINGDDVYYYANIDTSHKFNLIYTLVKSNKYDTLCKYCLQKTMSVEKLSLESANMFIFYRG